jgi:hypothetical protein
VDRPAFLEFFLEWGLQSCSRIDDGQSAGILPRAQHFSRASGQFAEWEKRGKPRRHEVHEERRRKDGSSSLFVSFASSWFLLFLIRPIATRFIALFTCMRPGRRHQKRKNGTNGKNGIHGAGDCMAPFVP